MPGLSIPVAMLIGSAVSGGTAIAGSALAGRGGNKSTSTTTPNLRPEQQQISQLLARLFTDQLEGRGEAPYKSERNAMRGQINSTYDAIGKRLESQLTARGFGESGKVGTGFKDLEIARAGDFQRGEAALQDRAVQRFLATLAQAQAFASPQGSTTVATGQQPSQVGPAIAGLGSNLATALWLSQILNQPTSPLPASPSYNYGSVIPPFRP